jgi:hypothetical protein
MVLREFRDVFLLKSRSGKIFVHYYYKISPLLAEMLRANIFLRTIFQRLLRPLVFFSKKVISTKTGIDRS